MYVAPNTTIKILHNVPLDTTYDHTIYFASSTSQASYFSGLAKYTLSAQSYQRVRRGWMRISIQAENLYDCNYLMFQNSAFGSKWFYAFIKSVEYINNAVSEVEFVLDVMQTWFFDYSLEMCFVEREHSATDVVGENLVPENLETGEYVTDGYSMPSALNSYQICVAATFDKTYTNVGGNIYAGMYSGLEYNFFSNDATGRGEVVAFIQNAGTLTDGIVSVFMVPSIFVRSAGTEESAVYPFSLPKNSTTIGSYTPKNNKLLTYPYTAMYVTNLQGGSAIYPFEYFDGTDCEFRFVGNCSPDCSIILAPYNYKGSGNNPNWDERLTLTNFPQCAYNTDTYKAWLAETCVQLPFTGLGQILNFAETALFPTTQTIKGDEGESEQVNTSNGAIHTLFSFARTVNQLCAQGAHYSMQPNKPHGGQANSSLLSAGILNFAFAYKHIRPEFAKIIDDYFTMYGYATHEVKVPNRNVRPHWTYTKTVGCKITGSIPSDDASYICNIYDHGITFWVNGSEVGDYSLNNTV